MRHHIFEGEQAKDKAPGSVSIILWCLTMGTITGAVCGSAVGFVAALPACLYGLLYGLAIGSVAGLAFGAVNGLALGLLLIEGASPETIDPQALRRACRSTSISASLVLSTLGYFGAFQIPESWVPFLWHTLWWSLFVAGPVTIISWFASGWFYRWYARSIPVPPGAAPYNAEVNI